MHWGVCVCHYLQKTSLGCRILSTVPTFTTVLSPQTAWDFHLLVAANWGVVIRRSSHRGGVVFNVNVDLLLSPTHDAVVARACSSACVTSTEAGELCNVAVQGICRQKQAKQRQNSCCAMTPRHPWHIQEPLPPPWVEFDTVELLQGFAAAVPAVPDDCVLGTSACLMGSRQL